jgi:hypothetical protein
LFTKLIPNPEPDPLPEPEPDPLPDPEPDPLPDPEPDPLPEPDPDPLPEPDPDPLPEPEPDPLPEPEPDPLPDPEPEPLPKPVPGLYVANLFNDKSPTFLKFPPTYKLFMVPDAFLYKLIAFTDASTPPLNEFHVEFDGFQYEI